jgi:energy-coupling factor transporter ATP-binding protein EcfA2
MFIDHPEAKAALADVWDNVVYCIEAGVSVAMLIIGESGAGKTTFQNELARQLERVYGRDDPEKTVKAALKVTVPSPCTPTEWCYAILKALGDPNPRKRDKSTLTENTALLVAACEVRAIIVDNFQDIPSARRRRGIEQVGVRIRELIDATRCVWVLLGTNAAREVINAESQLIKRVRYSAVLNYFQLKSADHMKRFRKLLTKLDEWLPLAERNGELLGQMSGLIFIATDGILDSLCKLLDRASYEAVVDQREHLQQQDLLRAFRITFGPGQPNPFTGDFEPRRLDGRNEPYEKLNSTEGTDSEERSKQRARAR